MDLQDPNLIIITALLGSWVLVTGGVWKPFERVEKVASQTARQKMFEWLTRIDSDQKPLNWAQKFIPAFDNVFGDRHLSWRCFLISSGKKIRARSFHDTFIKGAQYLLDFNLENM